MKLLAKSLLALILICCLLVLGAAGLLHGWVVPNINELKPRVENYLSEQTGHSVRIGNITAESSGFLPSFDLYDVQVLDGQQKSALVLGRVQVDVSPESILTFEIDRLSIDAPTLAAQRDSEGVLTIAGFKITPQATPGKALDWIFSQKEIVIKGGTLIWTDAMPHLFGDTNALPDARIEDVQLSLKNGLRSHAILLEAKPPVAFGQALRVTGKFTQPLLESHAGNYKAWTGSVDAQIKNIPELASAIKAKFDWPLKTANLDAEQLALVRLPQLAQMVGYKLPDALDALAGAQSTRLTAEAKNIGSDKLQLSVKAKMMHPDFAGDIDAQWKKEGEKIDASANFERIDLASLHRYVPLTEYAELRQSLQNVIQKGVASNVRVSLKGKSLGDLRIAGKVEDAQFTLPQKADTPKTPWANLSQTYFNFDFNGTKLELKNISSELAGISSKGSARIVDIKKPVIEANIEMTGSMASALQLVRTEPLKTIIKDVLATSEGTGNITSKLQLTVPMANPSAVKVQGFVQLQDNDFVLNATTPALSNLKGRINISGTGFQFNNVQANLLGGAIALSGNTQKISGTGTVSAESLAAWPLMPLRTQLVGRIKGKAPYSFSLEPRPGGAGLVIESTLVGMQLDLPAPLDKPAAITMPLRVQQVKINATQDRLLISLAHFIKAEFVRNLSPDIAKPAVVQRGSVAVASSPNYVQELVLPEQGVNAMLHMDFLDTSSWTTLLGNTNNTNAEASYIPSQIAAQFETLRFANRSFTQVVVGASRVGRTWRLNANASDFNGYGEYRQTASDQTGQVYLRLAKLILPDAGSQTQIEQLLQSAPERIPALDVVVDDFEVTGKKVGRLELLAVNQRSLGLLSTVQSPSQAQEWRVQKLNINNSDAALKATGVWLPSSDSQVARRVDMQFNLDITDAGALLDRFGALGTLKAGKGSLQGRVAWVGSPWSINIPTLSGLLKMEMSKGQFLKIEPGRAGRFFNVLSLQALPRLLTLDFRDVFSDGFAFDSLSGDAQMTNGVLATQNLQMKSVLALVSMDGTVDLAKETQNLHVLVLPDINAGGASLIATLINPVIGAATYLAQLVLRRPVIAAATKEYNIQGSWLEPQITQTKRNTPIAPSAP